MSSFSLREESGALVIRIDDPTALNDFRSNAFREELYETVEEHPSASVALNLSSVDFLSSSGVALLVGLKRRLDAQRGKFVLCDVQPIVHDLLRITRLVQFFTFASDEPEAVATLRSMPTA
jgi:anti-sigma B factor antagonist